MAKLIEAGKAASEQEESPGSVCFITHTSRSDIVMALLGHQLMETGGDMSRPSFVGGLIIAGTEGRRVEPFVENYIRSANMPVLRSNLPITRTMSEIKNLTPKMQADDEQRVRHVIDLYAPHLEHAVERLLSVPST